MPPVSHNILRIVQSWQNQQAPLVRALTAPMVEDVTVALDGVQQIVDGQEAELTAQQGRLREVLTRLEEMEKTSKASIAAAEASKAAAEVSQALVADLTAKLEATTDRIDVLERKQYGRRSEKRKKTPDARRRARKRRNNELTDEQKKARRKAAEAKRQAKLDALRTVSVTIPLPDSVGDGRQMPPVVSTLYEWQPGELVRIELSREQRATAEGFIATAPPVDQVVEGGCYGPALYAKICVDKCLNAMPLRRQERGFLRLGAPLPMSTLCALFHRAGDLVSPIYDALRAHVSTAPHVQADETPLPVLDEHRTRKGWMWVFASPDALLFVHSKSRGKGVPQDVLANTKGTLTVDGYTAYNSVTGELGRARGGCWSHARRGLYDARDHDALFIQPLLDDIGELFYVEELAADRGILGTADHLALRDARSRPAIDRLFRSLDDYDANVVDGRASITRAVRYILGQREPLQLFLTDAAVPIHNNLSERALRVIALLRKNSLFAGTDDAAQRFAQLLSLLATCQMHGVNPESWLADVLLAIGEPGLIAEDLLPWNWKTTRGPKYRPYFDTT
jgi:transposase